MAATITFLQAASSTSDLTTYTFSSHNLSTADAGRYIAIVVQTRTNTPTTISSVTIGGVTATITRQSMDAGGSSNLVGIVIAAVPTGTTGDVVVTYSTSTFRCKISTFYVLGISGVTASDHDASTATPPAVSLDIPAGGIALAGATCQFGGSSVHSWSGLTERTDSTVENMVASAASDEFATLQTGLSISCTVDGAGPVGVFASWAPAASGNPWYYYLQQRLLAG